MNHSNCQCPEAAIGQLVKLVKCLNAKCTKLLNNGNN